MNKKDWLKDFVSRFKGEIIEILYKPSAKKPREVARRAPGVRIIAMTNDKKFIISRERREYLEEEIDFRLPGGKVVDSLKEYHALLGRNALAEAIVNAAKKELIEETGITARSIRQYQVSNSGGTIDWDLYYFEMKELSFGEATPEDGEEITVLELTVSEVIDLILSKQMSEDRSRMILLDYLIEHFPIELSKRIAVLHKK